VRRARIAPDGTVLDPGGILLDDDVSFMVDVAFDGTSYARLERRSPRDLRRERVHLWRAARRGRGRARRRRAPLSRSANAQNDPSLAFDGQDFVVTWTDDRNTQDLQEWDVYAARVSAEGDLLDGAATLLGTGTARQSHPRAVFDGSSALVAWWDCAYVSEVDCSIAGARWSSGGATPLSFPYHVWDFPRVPPALSSGGGGAVVSPMYDLDAGLVAAVVGPDGVEGPEVFAQVEASTRLASAFDGVNHLVVWIPEERAGGPLFGARIAPDGAVLDPGGFEITPSGSDARTFSLAFGGGEYLVAWHDATAGFSRVLAARVSPDGAVLDPAPVVVEEHEECPAPEHPEWGWPTAVDLGASAVAFDGKRFVLGWRACGPESADLFGALINVGGAVRARFTITSDANPDETPALGGAGKGGTLIAYSSFRAEAPFGAWRVYTRRLDVAPWFDAGALAFP
jgi:hypothetical protein